MNITLKLNNEPIQRATCNIYSDSYLSKPVILSNGNGAGTNTITADVYGVIKLTASNCPSTIYCRIESDAYYNNSANFRLKTGIISGVSPSAAAKTINMGFTAANIFVPTSDKCAIGYDLLTLGYRYDLSKRSINTPTTKISKNNLFYNKAFTYAEINSLDKVSFIQSVTQTSFSFSTSSISTSARNTTRGVNLSTPTAGIHGDFEEADKYCSEDITVDYIDDDIPIYNYAVTSSYRLVLGNYNKQHFNLDPNCIKYKNKIHTFFPVCTLDFSTSCIPGYIQDEHQIALDTNNMKLTFTGTLTSGMMAGFHGIEVQYMLTRAENQTGNVSDDIIWSYTATSNGPTSSNTPSPFYLPSLINVGGDIGDFDSDILNTKYLFVIRVTVHNFKDYTAFNLNVSNTPSNHRCVLSLNTPDKVVLFGNDDTGVNKNPKLPVHMLLEKADNSWYNDYSLYIRNAADANIAEHIVSGADYYDKSQAADAWVNGNPAKIGTTTVSYSNLYGYLCAYGRKAGGKQSIWNYFLINTPTQHLYEYTSIVPTNLSKNVNATTISAYPYTDYYSTSTNIFRSVNEQLNGKHMLLYAYTKINN